MPLVADVIVIGAGLSGLVAARELEARGIWAAGERNHAGQGVKAWVLARGVPDDLCAMGHGTRFDFAGAMPSFMDGAVESGHRVADEVDRGGVRGQAAGGCVPLTGRRSASSAE